MNGGNTAYEDLNRAPRWTCYTAGGLFLLLAVLAALHPFLATSSIAVTMGIGFIISGANMIVPYISTRGKSFCPFWMLPMALLDVIVGILFLTHIALAIFTLTAMLGMRSVAGSVVSFYEAFRMRSSGSEEWKWMLAGAVLSLAIGIAMIASPFSAALLVGSIAGVGLACAGILAIATGRLIYPPSAARKGR